MLILISALIIEYYVDKNRRAILLHQVLNNEIFFDNIYITEPDGDGYQSIKASILKNGKIKHETLSLHFDIPIISKILSEYNIPYTGKYIE